MKRYYEALRIVLDSVKEIGNEKVSFIDSLDRVLAEDIFANEDNPPEDNSGMDGFAVRFDDISIASAENPVVLKLIGEAKAGGDKLVRVEPGTAVAIYTGGLIPNGADTVIPKEFTKVKGDEVYILQAFKRGVNIREKGSDYKKGDLLLEKGSVIRPVEVGVLSSVNKATVYVKRRPRVGIITTGDEILDIAEPKTLNSQIRTSNTYTLCSQIKNAGGEPVIVGFVKDNPVDMKEKLRWAKSFDVLLTTGGVSVGEYDIVKDLVVKELGVDLIFWKVAQKPGKPVAFGIWGEEKEKLFFGIPGNPVACMVVFETLVKPAIRKLGGYKNYFNPVIKAKLSSDYRRKSADRLEFVRVSLSFNDGQFLAMPFEKQASNMLTSMINANGLMIVEEGVDSIEKDSLVNVIVFDRGFLDGKGF